MKSIIIAFIVCLVALTACNQRQLGSDKYPNIIFVFVDDMGYGDLGVLYQNERAKNIDYSMPAAKTPYLDQLAHEGALLTHHYCAAPVCAPSRTSLLTGLSQGHANIRNNQFDKALADNHTMATILKQAGYSTAAFGKWGTQGTADTIPNWPAHPNKRGFDYYLGYIGHADGHEHYPKEGKYRGSKDVYENYTNITEDLDKCYTADLWTAAAKRWIVEQTAGREENKPFFAYLAYDTPHAVLELPTQAYPNGGGLNGGIQWTNEPRKMINTASGEIDSWIHPDYMSATYDHDKDKSTPNIEWPDVYKRYATSTRRIDNAIGDLVQLLKDLKIENNTLIVFSSDNGPSRASYLPESYSPEFFHSYGPFEGIKRDCYEGGVRVPTLAWWPTQIPAGQVIKKPSISYDWLPTLAEIAGIPAPANADGVSLLPSLTGKGEQAESNIYVEYQVRNNTPEYDDFSEVKQGRKRGQMQMIRLNEWVGVRYNIQSHSDDFEIYNILSDPRQRINLAFHEGMKLIQNQMKDKVLQSRRLDSSAKRPYDNELVPAIEVSSLKPGIRWQFYEGEFPWVPDVKLLTPLKSGVVERIETNQKTLVGDGAIGYTGYIKIPKDGQYIFSLSTTKGAFMRIHDCALFDADFGYKKGELKTAKISLKAGYHPVELITLIEDAEVPFINLSCSKCDKSEGTNLIGECNFWY